MDAVRLISRLRPLLVESGVPWALAGGFALVAWGSTRTTLDLDLLVDEAGRKRLLPALSQEGFVTIFDSEGFTNLQHPDPLLGRLDLIWIEGKTSRVLFGATEERTGPDGLPVRVPRREHLIAMKVRAIQSRPARVIRDAPDINFLLNTPGIDENEARGYFEKAGLLDLFLRLRRTP